MFEQSGNDLKEAAGAGVRAPQERQEPALSGKSRTRHILVEVGWGTLLALGLLAMVQFSLMTSQATNDFCQDYLGAQRILHGISIYLPLRCFRGIMPIPTPVEYDSHPPTSALFFVPFGFMSLASATLVWSFGCLAAYLASGFLLLRVLGWRLLRGMALFVLFSLFWLPFLQAQSFLNFGQLVTFLLVAVWWLERKHQARWAGGLLGLAALLKLWPAVLIFLAVVARRWKLAVAWGATVVAGMLLALGVLGWDAYSLYLGPVRVDEAYWIPNGGNISIVGAVARPLSGYQAAPIPLPALAPGVSVFEAVTIGEIVAALFLGGILLLVAWVCWRNPGEQVVQISQSLLLTVSQLVFPLTWNWSLPTMLLAVTILILVLREMPRPPRWWFLLMGAGLLLFLNLAWPLRLLGGGIDWLLRQSAPGLAGLGVLLLGLSTYGLLLFAAGQVWLLWRAHAVTLESAPPAPAALARSAAVVGGNDGL